MDCQGIVFSPAHSNKRIKKALLILPELVVKKMLFFSLYLLGARVGAIASLVGMPEESGRTIIKRISKGGLPALYDRRQSAKAHEYQLPNPAIQSRQVSVITEGDNCLITFFDSEQQVKILRKHRVHLRSVLLTLLQAGLISAQTASSALGVTTAHCLDLSEKLLNKDVAEVLLDKRRGQTNDLLVNPQVKAELVQQFAARSIAGYSVSGKALARAVNDNLQTAISDRTVRWHMKKLGLMEIKNSLPKLVKSFKKKLLTLLDAVGVKILPTMPIQAKIHSIAIMRRKAAAALVAHGVTLCAAATFVGCSISTVSRSLKRINEVENVADYERSGRPALYSEELRLKLIGFY